MIDHKYIPLLSKKSIHEMTPEEYKAHVIGLHWKPERKKRIIAKKKKEFSFRLTAKGSLSIRINRESKVLTQEELATIVVGSGKTMDEVLAYIKKTKGKISVVSIFDAEENNSQISLSI